MSADEQREALTVIVGAPIWSTSNYPRRAQPYILGQDISGLRGAVVDAILASDWLAQVRREAAGEALDQVRDEIAGSVSYGFELNQDGTEDREAAAYVEGLHATHDIVQARATALRSGVTS